MRVEIPDLVLFAKFFLLEESGDTCSCLALVLCQRLLDGTEPEHIGDRIIADFPAVRCPQENDVIGFVRRCRRSNFIRTRRNAFPAILLDFVLVAFLQVLRGRDSTGRICWASLTIVTSFPGRRRQAVPFGRRRQHGDFGLGPCSSSVGVGPDLIG
jgi:hypothetical protein